MRTIAMAACLVFAWGLTGCSDDVTVYQPGVYKGKVDPLLAKQANAEHQAQLRERLKQVQGAE
jgi:hypothetical protein